MELRKIQVTGGSTHVISLPKKWVDRSGLGRSDTLAIVEEADGSLLVVPHGDAPRRERRIIVDVPEPLHDRIIIRKLVGAYLAGADSILIRGRGRLDPKVRPVVRDTIRDLVGVEIVEEAADSIELQDLVGVADMDLRKTVTRMYRIARIMFDDALRALLDRDHELARDVTSRDDELDRLEWHVSKQMHALLEQPRLAARLGLRPAEALNFYLVARATERMGDHASKICRNIVELEADTAPEAIESIGTQAQVVGGLWDDAFSALKRSDFEQASEASDAGRAAGAWRGGFVGLIKDLPGAAATRLAIIADSVDRVRGYAIDISETAMNHTFLSE